VQRSQSRTPKPGTKDGAAQRAPASASTISASAQRTPQFAQRQEKTPAIPLRNGAAQKKVAVGEAGDPYEREADAVSNKVKNGQAVQASSISSLSAGAISRMANDQKKPEVGSGGDQKPVQKQAATAWKPEQKPDEKRPESKAVQKAATPASAKKPEEKKPESKAVQKAETPKPAQKPEGKKPESKAVQKAEAGRDSTPESSASDVAEQAIVTRGSGRPLHQETRDTLESKMGADFGDVRVHDDAAAQDAAGNLDARAFTHQSDIWLGAGESDKDVGLMAHEATHVLQQSNGVQRQMIQRKKKKQKGKKGGASAEEATITGNTMEIPGLSLPDKYEKNTRKFDQPIPKSPKRPRDQRDMWIKGVNADSAVETKLPDSAGIESKLANKKLYYLKLKGEDSFMVGDKDTLKERLRLPNWRPSGVHYPIEVDHKEEIQLGGPHSLDNLQLLGFKANRSSGTQIQNEIIDRIEDAIADNTGPGKKWEKRPPDAKTARQRFDIKFKALDGKLDLPDDVRWTRADIEAGKHLDAIQVLDLAAVRKHKLLQDKNELKIFKSGGVGKPEREDWDPDDPSYSKTINKKNWNDIKGFDLTGIKYEPGGSDNKLSGTIFKRNHHVKEKDFPVPLIEDAPYTVRMSLGSLRQTVISLRHASPVEIIDVRMEKSVYITGILRPSLPIFKNLELDITIDGDNVTLSKTFGAEDFNLPKPITINSASLTLGFGTAGLDVRGDILFEIERVGKGKVSGLGSTSKGFAVEGEFEFDTKLFDPAMIKAWYKDEEFGMAGKIGIKEGKVKGIKRASAEVSYTKGKLEASGKAELLIPGIKAAAMNMSYSDAEGLMVGGAFELADNIPGIKSGGGEVQVKQKKDGEGYEITAHGKAVPNIPGISSSIDIRYENDAITIEGTVGYEKGMLKGSVMIGVTNRPVDEAGRPGDGPGGKELKIYGSGSVTIKIAPWLQGTIGIMFLPNGEIVVTGEVGLPSSIDLFPEKKFDKNLFKIGIDIPIVGVSVLGQNIGIFASIGGGLDLSAGIGPIQLQELGLSVTYNPAHEEQTTVTGRGKLHIPAHAGLRLFVRGSLGVGIPIVDAKAGLEIGAGLGLEGALDAGVEVNWSPMQGLKIDAFGEVYVEPKLKFDITGFVEVEADLLFDTITLYEKKWQLASFEFGSGLRFGVKFPIHYEEGKPFNVSLDDLQFQVPDIDPMDLLTRLIDQI
jgi:hypothetical protein